MSRGHVECASLLAEANATWYLDGVATGARCQVLSRDPESGAHSARVILPPFWCWPVTGSMRDEVELFVLSGAFSLGGDRLHTGDYAVLGAGRVFDGLASESGAELLWLSAGATVFQPAPLMARPSPWSLAPRATGQIPWLAPPSFEGRTTEEAGPGLAAKYLREDPRTTAYTLMTRIQPGWSDPRMEAHDTWEELILLEGDYLMGNTGTVYAGTYIFRPGLRPHGPQATQRGAVWFCRGEKRIDFQFEALPFATDRARRYLASAALPLPEARLHPWGRF